MYKIKDELYTENLWNIKKDAFIEKEAITDGSNFMIGNGYLGYRGTFAESRKADYVGCFVTDTWDKADDKWEELCNAPNALYLKLFFDSKAIDLNHNNDFFSRELDVRHAITKRHVKFNINNIKIELSEEKFASYTKKNVVMMKYELLSENDIELNIEYGIDNDVWDLNGKHLRNHKYEKIDDNTCLDISETYLYKDKLVVLEHFENIHGNKDDFIKMAKIKLFANKPYIIYKTMIVCSSNDVENPHDFVIESKNDLKSYEVEKQEHSLKWEELWSDFDIEIKGNPIAQIGYRFNTYHSIIATPVHKHLPIGARGLSCQAYQGSAFWDQEIYNLPMYLYTKPEYAKEILTYRYHTLDGARRKAKKHNYEGAFYAWISGKTGDELCPDFFFKDVITDRKIRNHFNLWQIHISPDIAYTIDKYYRVTKDRDFMEKMGIEMVFEIARFLASRVDYKPRRNRYELQQVQGPDEYHENIDNNAFTNYQTYFTFEIALKYIKEFDNKIVGEIKNKIDLDNIEINLWQDILKKLYLPKLNEAKILEQFDDYFKLESIVPADKIKERLINPEEYYGWPNGIAVFTQCLKQSDVLQLMHLHPRLFDIETIKANFNYYEPRTLHFSSLSPSIHSIIATWIKNKEKAEYYFSKAISIDMMNTNEAISGGTFIGGMHTAANGACWQMITIGMSGFLFEDDKLYLSPFLTNDIESLNFKVHINKQTIKIFIDKKNIKLINVTKTKIVKVNINEIDYDLIDKINIKYK